jgi:hypothetical protein
MIIGDVCSQPRVGLRAATIYLAPPPWTQGGLCFETTQTSARWHSKGRKGRHFYASVSTIMTTTTMAMRLPLS